MILVYDVHNSKSYANLVRWMAEILAAEQEGRKVVTHTLAHRGAGVASVW